MATLVTDASGHQSICHDARSLRELRGLGGIIRVDPIDLRTRDGRDRHEYLCDLGQCYGQPCSLA